MEPTTLSHPAPDTSVRIVPLADGRIQIRTATERMSIGRQARLALDLLSLCDGRRSAEEVKARLVAAGHPSAQVDALFDLLASKLVLTDEHAEPAPDLVLDDARHLARQVLRASSNGAVRAAERDVYVLGMGHLAAAVRAEILQLALSATADCAPVHPGAPLIIACSDYENHASFRDANARALQDRSPILFACIANPVVRIGPCVVPRESACFECYHQRLRSNLAYRDEFDGLIAQNNAIEAAGADSRAHFYARLAATLVAAQVVNFLQGALHNCLIDSIAEFHPLSVELSTHRVLRLPRCEVCGRSEATAPAAAVRDWL